MLRREIIGGVGAVAALGLLNSRKAAATGHEAANRDVLVCVFLRGAADGLNILVPHGDPYYYEKRGAVAIPEPGAPGGAIDIDGYFGLHPALGSLYERVGANIAFIPAVGNPLGSHSHFDAMKSMEYASGGVSGANGGWLGRYLSQTTPAEPNPTVRAVAVNNGVQASLNVDLNDLSGYPANVIAALKSEDFQLNINDDGQYQDTLETLYGCESELDENSRTLIALLEKIKTTQPWLREPQNGAVYPEGGQGLGERMQSAAQFINAFNDLEVVCVDMGGWDTHANERNRMNLLVAELAGSLEAFHQDMGSDMNNITVLVMTEFGRRIAANNSAGTDHGTGSCMIAMGGGVNGTVHANHWDGGLVNMRTHDGDVNAHHGDVKVAVDFRDVFAQLMQRRLGFVGDWNKAFPGHGFQELGFDLFQSR